MLAVAACGCASRPPVSAPARTPHAVRGTTEEGVASWYGHPYHGRATTSGEVYDMHKLTAAHRTLPLGTRVRVQNLSNGREVEVRINDRGPFVESRVIDLSLAAARRIAMVGPGTARVRLRVLGSSGAPAGGFFAVQVGSFRNLDNANRLRQSLEQEYGATFLRKYESPQGLFYRVLVGRQNDLSGAERLAEKFRADGLAPLVVRVDESSTASQL